MVIERVVNGFNSSISNSGGMPIQSQCLNGHDIAGTSSQLIDNAATAQSSGTQGMMSLLFSLSILKEKVDEVESFVNIFLDENIQNPQPVSELAVSSMAHLMQEVVEAASCMMLNCQQMGVGSSTRALVDSNVYGGAIKPHHHQLLEHQKQVIVSEKGQDDELGGLVSQVLLVGAVSNKRTEDHQKVVDDDGDSYNWYIPREEWATNYNLIASNTTTTASTTTNSTAADVEIDGASVVVDHVVELDAADLLARYTHYCQVCGRGFKREANLKMHMRAHGDQYRSSLMSNNSHMNNKIHEEEINTTIKSATRYSCPHKGCRWNKKHAKFKPLKSIVCVKNHYKRSHCPKMFMCKKCNTKHFSVLSDLKSHEKQCGEATNWYCSCGTSFSKKDKLMDHVALFVGHTPLIKNLAFGYQAS